MRVSSDMAAPAALPIPPVRPASKHLTGRLRFATGLVVLIALALGLAACGGGSGYTEIGASYYDDGYWYYDDPYYWDDPYYDDPCGCYYYKAGPEELQGDF